MTTKILAARPLRIQSLNKITTTKHYIQWDTGIKSISFGNHRHFLLVAAASDDGITQEGAANAFKAIEGDLVTIHWTCMNEQGEILESTHTAGEPTSFEVGAGDIVGNQLFEAFDEAIRGLAVGESTGIKVQGTPWEKDLLFTVPREHEEIQRLEGRYKNQGGIQDGMLVELANGDVAMVVRCDEKAVMLDANGMLAGKTLLFELELVDLERA